MNFRWTHPTTRTVVHTEAQTTDFYNLKSKAAGARRIGYANRVEKFVNADGEIAFRAEFQTTLNGERYQSSKGGAWRATEAEAVADLKKTLAGALKRYTKLAQDPDSKIEHRA